MVNCHYSKRKWSRTIRWFILAYCRWFYRSGIKTDGSGTLSWSSAGTSINGLSDALVEDNSTYLGNDPSSTTDDRNVAVGLIALDAITTGDNNVAVGYNALTANTTGSHNIGIGTTL